VLDLKRMNRVIEVDERMAYALVEPGVSYFDLYRYISERNLDVWIDPPDPGWGSVIGNALDGGGGWTASPYRDHFGAHCGMEVVLANGDLVRTGMGAMPEAQTWQHNRWGFGPWVDGLFRQSNFGIVTKMGFHLMPRPEAFQSATVQVFNEEDIIPLVDHLNYLENIGTVNGSTQIGRGFGAPDGGQAPRWTLTLPVYGPEKVVRASMEYMRERFADIPGAVFNEAELIRTPLTAEQYERVRLVNFGIPNLGTFGSLTRNAANPNPPGGHIGFSPLVPRRGEDIIAFHRFYQENLEEVTGGEDLRILGPVMMTNWDRSLVCLIMFPIGRDPVMNGKIRNAFRKWVTLAKDQGWSEYRTAAAFMDEVSDTYSFNDHALRRLRESIKDAVDPNGIISAGRYGVWPRHLRQT
jgi:4-cresol dehydrogenase (hydroxylating)